MQHQIAGSAQHHRGNTLSCRDAIGFSIRAVSMPVLRTSTVRANLMKLKEHEYAVRMEQPLGLGFAVSDDGNVFVKYMEKGSKAERLGIIKVADSLKKFGGCYGKFIEINQDSLESFENCGASACTLVLERLPCHIYPAASYAAGFKKWVPYLILLLYLIPADARVPLGFWLMDFFSEVVERDVIVKGFEKALCKVT